MSVAKKSHASAEGLATAQQEILQITWVAFAISSVNLCVLVEAVLYSKKFSSAKNFVKSDRPAVRQEFIFSNVGRRLLLFGRSVVVLLLIVYLHMHVYF